MFEGKGLKNPNKSEKLRLYPKHNLEHSLEFRGKKLPKYRVKFPLGSISAYYYERQDFNAKAIQGLARTIQKNGLITPLSIEELEDGSFMLLGGFRRIKALEILSISEAPALLYTGLTEDQRLDVCLIDNVQHEALSDWDTAQLLNRYRDPEGALFPLEIISTRTGKSPSWISQKLAVLKDSLDIQKAIRSDTIKESQARSIRRAPEILHSEIIPQVEGKSVQETAAIVDKVIDANKGEQVRQEIENYQDTLNEIEIAEKKLPKIDSEIARLEGELKALDLSDKGLEKQVSIFETLETQYFPKVAELEGVQSEMKAIRKMLPDYPLETLDKELKDLNKEIGAIDPKIAELRKQLKKLDNEKKSLIKSKKIKETQIGEYNKKKRRLSALETVESRLKGQVTTLDKKYTAEIEKFDAEKSKLNDSAKEALENRLKINQVITNMKKDKKRLLGKINNRSNIEALINTKTQELAEIETQAEIEAQAQNA